ncbi:nuclear protein UL55 [Saimiriine alphaherpesvirus 1]|uniref:Nuclear protein UL55 n=1 Tax=Saimiriine herpesvirus 1 (strain MV-5-4-PSL) TaxID=10353 RepID=E2IUB5_SHV1|nr:nuclear protein UL55 [Saimiriine alphaherpesvirus 1]ADO13773.1 nuclear protein UL55 [Saimiriine alphaherpesvirus 1]
MAAIGNPTFSAFAGAPDVSHVAPPLAINVGWKSGGDERVVQPDPISVDMRSYHLRSTCAVPGTVHGYFMQVLKDRRRHLKLSVSELRTLASLLNCEPVLQQLRDKLPRVPPCPRPFGPGSIRSQPTAKKIRSTDPAPPRGYTVDGLTYHCHCGHPFSLECWRGAAAAATHIRSTSAGITASRAAEKQRAALRLARETAC